MPRPLLVVSQSDCLIQVVDKNSHTKCKRCRPRSVGFFRSRLIWICTVCKGSGYTGSAGPGLKVSDRTTSNEYPQYMLWINKKIFVWLLFSGAMIFFFLLYKPLAGWLNFPHQKWALTFYKNWNVRAYFFFFGKIRRMSEFAKRVVKVYYFNQHFKKYEPASAAQFDAGGLKIRSCGLYPRRVGNILSWRLIMKYFLRSFSPADSRRAVVSFWWKDVHNTG